MPVSKDSPLADAVQVGQDLLERREKMSANRRALKKVAQVAKDPILKGGETETAEAIEKHLRQEYPEAAERTT